MANIGTLAQKRVQKQEEEKSRIEANREQIEADAAAARDITVRDVPRGVDPEKDSMDPFENKKLGEQDLPIHLKSDGRTDGVRWDQMEGVQSAFENNALDPEEMIEDNLANPVRLETRMERAPYQAYGLEMGDDIPVSPRTQEEMNAGKNALGNGGFGSQTSGTNDREQNPASNQSASSSPAPAPKASVNSKTGESKK